MYFALHCRQYPTADYIVSDHDEWRGSSVTRRWLPTDDILHFIVGSPRLITYESIECDQSLIIDDF